MFLHKIAVLFTVAMCVNQQQFVRGELYTALADMEELLETESVLIDTLHGYITVQEQRLATLRRYVQYFFYDLFLKKFSFFFFIHEFITYNIYTIEDCNKSSLIKIKFFG